MNEQYIKLEDSVRDGYYVAVEALVGGVLVSAVDAKHLGVNTYISYPDARKLVEMLIKHTHPGQKLSLPMPVTAPMAHLIVGYSHDSGKRFLKVSCLESASVNAQALKRAEPNRPVWLGYLTKEFVQPTPSYEWKDL